MSDPGTKKEPDGNGGPGGTFTATCGPGQHLEAIFNSVSDGILALDRSFRVTRANQAALAITGYTKEEVVGLPCFQILQEEPGPGGCALRKTIESGADLAGERLGLVTRDGARKTVLFSTRPLRNRSGEAAGLVVVFRDVTELESLREEVRGRYRFHQLIAKSGKMQDLFRLIEQAAGSDATVVVEGETGTGKELVARAIHYNSLRADGPFVPVNCAALAEGVLESELFGHVKGAFTGATRDKKGRFEAAEGGTLFLDELGDISPLIQLKLLRVVQEREIHRVGSSEPIKVDVRLVAATNKDLREQVKKGEFREDLFYRLRVVALTLPPLRERREDIPLLVNHFIEKQRQKTGKPISGCEEAVMRLFLTFEWPGNVRELENAIERAFVVTNGPRIALEDLPPEVLVGTAGTAAEARRRLRSAESQGERAMILQALADSGWNKTGAARRLGIARNTLYAKMEHFGIPKSPPVKPG